MVGLCPRKLRRVLGRERLKLDSTGLDYFWCSGLTRLWRLVPLEEIESVSIYVNRGADLGPGFGHSQYGLEIQTLGHPLRVGQGRQSEEIAKLQSRVRTAFATSNRAWVNCISTDGRTVLDRSSILAEPPADCAIVCRRDWDYTEFVSRSRPHRRQRWNIRAGEVTSSVRMLGLGWSQTAEVEWLDHFELRRRPKQSGWHPLQIGFNKHDPGFDLALVDLKDNDVAVLGLLTRGEALWMAGIIADVLKDALPKEGQIFARWSVSADASIAGSKAMADRWLDESVYS